MLRTLVINYSDFVINYSDLKKTQTLRVCSTGSWIQQRDCPTWEVPTQYVASCGIQTYAAEKCLFQWIIGNKSPSGLALNRT